MNIKGYAPFLFVCESGWLQTPNWFSKWMQRRECSQFPSCHIFKKNERNELDHLLLRSQFRTVCIHAFVNVVGPIPAHLPMTLSNKWRLESFCNDMKRTRPLADSPCIMFGSLIQFVPPTLRSGHISPHAPKSRFRKV